MYKSFTKLSKLNFKHFLEEDEQFFFFLIRMKKTENELNGQKKEMDLLSKIFNYLLKTYYKKILNLVMLIHLYDK